MLLSFPKNQRCKPHANLQDMNWESYVSHFWNRSCFLPDLASISRYKALRPDGFLLQGFFLAKVMNLSSNLTVVTIIGGLCALSIDCFLFQYKIKVSMRSSFDIGIFSQMFERNDMIFFSHKLPPLEILQIGLIAFLSPYFSYLLFMILGPSFYMLFPYVETLDITKQ